MQGLEVRAWGADTAIVSGILMVCDCFFPATQLSLCDDPQSS